MRGRKMKFNSDYLSKTQVVDTFLEIKTIQILKMTQKIKFKGLLGGP